MPRLRWMFFAAIVTLGIFISVTVCYFEIRRLDRLTVSVDEGTARLAELQQRVRNYREKVAFYETEEGMAHLAREQYNLVFPGERIFVINRESSTAPWR